MADGQPPHMTASLPPTGIQMSTHQVDPRRPSPDPLSSAPQQIAPPAPLPQIIFDPTKARVPYPSMATLGSSFNLPSSSSTVGGAAKVIPPLSLDTPIPLQSTVPQPVTVPTQQVAGPKPTPGKRKRTFKVIIVGDAGVGKTCLSFRFCNGRFPEYTEATIGVDFRERTVVLEGETLKVQLWDTAGQERYRQSIVAHYYRNVHAVVFVYDVSCPKSFASLPAWLVECDKHGLGPNAEIPRILIGNKCDLEAGGQRVCTDSAQIFADQHNMALFETSAKKESEADHVESIFMTLVHHLHRSKAMHVQSERERQDKEHQTLLLKADQAAAMQDEGWCC